MLVCLEFNYYRVNIFCVHFHWKKGWLYASVRAWLAIP